MGLSLLYVRKLTKKLACLTRFKEKVGHHELEIKGEKFLIERESFFFKELNREFIDLIDYPNSKRLKGNRYSFCPMRYTKSAMKIRTTSIH